MYVWVYGCMCGALSSPYQSPPWPRLGGCIGVGVYGCIGVWVYGCIGVWVYGCMCGALSCAYQSPPWPTLGGCMSEYSNVLVYVCMCVCGCMGVWVERCLALINLHCGPDLVGK